MKNILSFLQTASDLGMVLVWICDAAHFFYVHGPEQVDVVKATYRVVLS